jgi:hypothetical protein
VNGGEGRLAIECGKRVDVGDVCACACEAGREGSEGMPREERGDGWRSEEDEWCDGEPDESVDALKGCTGLMFGRRMGKGDGGGGIEGRSCAALVYCRERV